MDKTKVFNCDCLEAMKQYENGFFDIAIVDPPYGDGGEFFNRKDSGRFGGRFDRYKTGHGWADKYGIKQIQWDIAPPPEYFDELFRVSKNQIIFGGNYFGLPPCRCFIAWHKTNIPLSFTMSNVEYAWTSFNDNAKIFECSSQRSRSEESFHPTEKPIALYEWIIKTYTAETDKILDTHLGSGSSRIAAYNLNREFVGYEIDKEYFEKQEERFRKHTAQLRIF